MPRKQQGFWRWPRRSSADARVIPGRHRGKHAQIRSRPGGGGGKTVTPVGGSGRLPAGFFTLRKKGTPERPVYLGQCRARKIHADGSVFRERACPAETQGAFQRFHGQNPCPASTRTLARGNRSI